MARRTKGINIKSKEDLSKQINIVKQEINIRPINRQPIDIQKVKLAIQSAESTTNPNRSLLYDIYGNIKSDGHLTGLRKKLFNAVTGAEWEFSKMGKVIPRVNDLIDTVEFDKTLKEIVNSILWGLTWIEFSNFTKEGFNLWVMPRKHCRPETGDLVREQNGFEPVLNIREGIYAKTCMEIGEPDDLGAYFDVVQYVVYKRGNFGDWAQFAEIFGMPFRIGEYDSYDETQKAQLEKALDEAGSAAYAVIPKGSSLRFEKNPSTGDGQLYNLLKNACNQEMSVALLTVTETTTSSSSSGYAQSKEHGDQQDDIFKGLRDYVRRILNRKFVPILQANGIDTEGGYFIVKGEGEEKLSLKERFEIHIRMIKELGLPYDVDSLYEQYGLTKPKDFDAQVKAKKEEKEAFKKAITPKQEENKNLSAETKTLWEKAKYFFGLAPQS
ncbi:MULTISPECIES: phage portal protein family protein [Olivibacter]|uniref:DUF935 family protein n=1 Tax=Olivibacter jilunii TaxID=985016 RepID=A0ABW6AZ55_9SPHI